MILVTAGVCHPHWHVHLVMRMYYCGAQDARAQTCAHLARASQKLRDARIWLAARIWVGHFRARHWHPMRSSHPWSISTHLDVEDDNQSVIGTPAHPWMERAYDTCAWASLGRVRERCVHLACACL